MYYVKVSTYNNVGGHEQITNFSYPYEKYEKAEKRFKSVAVAHFKHIFVEHELLKMKVILVDDADRIYKRVYVT